MVFPRHLYSYISHSIDSQARRTSHGSSILNVIQLLPPIDQRPTPEAHIAGGWLMVLQMCHKVLLRHRTTRTRVALSLCLGTPSVLFIGKPVWGGGRGRSWAGGGEEPAHEGVGPHGGFHLLSQCLVLKQAAQHRTVCLSTGKIASGESKTPIAGDGTFPAGRGKMSLSLKEPLAAA